MQQIMMDTLVESKLLNKKVPPHLPEVFSIKIPQNFGIFPLLSSFPDSSWTTTSNYPKNVEVVYESTPDEQQQLSYQESTYHELPSSAEETTYQDTPPQPIYQQKNEYPEDIPKV